MLGINLFFQDIANPLLDKFFLYVSYLITDIPLVLVLCFIYWCVNKEKGLKIGFILLNSMMINFIVKDIFKVDRPYVKDSRIINKDIKYGYGYSFPSNHSQLASGLVFSLYKVFGNIKYLITGFFTALLVAISRIYLGVHSILDVTVGFLLGLMLVPLFGVFIDYVCKSKKYYLGYIFIILGLTGIIAFGDEDSLKITMVYLGFLTGLIVENKLIGYKIPGTGFRKTANFLMGVSGVAVIYIFLSGWIKYLLIGFWVSLGAPFIFKVLNGKDEV